MYGQATTQQPSAQLSQGHLVLLHTTALTYLQLTPRSPSSSSSNRNNPLSAADSSSMYNLYNLSYKNLSQLAWYFTYNPIFKNMKSTNKNKMKEFESDREKLFECIGSAFTLLLKDALKTNKRLNVKDFALIG